MSKEAYECSGLRTRLNVPQVAKAKMAAK